MAKFILTNALVLVNSIDLSDHADKVTTEDSRDQVELTSFGAANKSYGKGLGDAKITIEFFQDYAGGSVHATLSALISSSTPVPVEVRAVNAARSPTNPAILLSGALLFTYNGIDAQLNAASQITAEFVNGSNTGMTYPTA